MSQQMQPGQLSKSSAQGEFFGRYRLRGILGQGGMGQLYVAEQVGIEGFSKVVALKRVLPHLADSPHFRAMFLNEARVAARLEHPNIVATFELGEVDGNYFMSMEYLPGEDLAAVLGRCQAVGAMPVEIAAVIAQQCANGLHYAHEMRDPSGKAVELVHRDVCPLNIFMTYYGTVKLLDFGIVKSAADSVRTVPGVFKGKYAYSAPEQLDGGAVNRQTDVFGLGIVLWECLTGRRLFLRNSDAGTIDAVRGHVVEPPSAFRKEVPPELDEIVLRALARERGARFSSAYAMSEALDRFLTTRRHRPTSGSLGSWLESIFGSQRAALKKAIAQGSDVEAALDLLPALGGERSVTGESQGGAGSPSAAQPRMLWSSSLASSAGSEPKGAAGSGAAGQAAGSTGHSRSVPAVFRVPPAPVAAPVTMASGWRPASWRLSRVAAISVVVGAAAAGAVVIRSRSSPAAPAAPTAGITGAIALETDPPGAQIFVDGDPSGLATPTVLTGLRPGRSVEIRLAKVGFKPVTERIEVKAGEARSRSFHLIEALGTIVIEGLASAEIIYLDGTLVEGRGPLSVSIGEHQVRIETATGVVLSQTLDVAPGQQTIRVPAHVVTQKKGGPRR